MLVAQFLCRSGWILNIGIQACKNILENERSGFHLVRFAALVLCLPALLHAGQPDNSQQDLKQMSLEQLSQIEVTTPTKQPESAFNTPAAIYVITSEDIRRSGVTNIPEALRLAPGVEVARIDGDKWSIGIRGFGSRLCRDVLVVIDGRTVYTTLLAGTYWEVQDYPLEDIERIEVIRGPGGTIWGPNAVNGVINIITKRAKDTQGGMVSAATGSFDHGTVNGRYGNHHGDNLQYRFYGRGFDRGPQFHWDGRNFDDWSSLQGGFRVDWNDKAQVNAFTLSGDIYDQRAGESVVATSYTPPFSQVLDQDARLSGGNVNFHWHHDQGEGKSFDLQAYYDRTNRREPNFGDLRDTYDVDFVQHWRLFDRHKVTWGLGARFSHGDNIEVVSGLTFSPADRTDRLLTAFIQDEFTLVNKRLVLTYGSKFLNTNFTDYAPEPSARLLWTPTDTTSVWAAATHAVRTPSDAERDFFLSGLVAVLPDGTPYFARFNANRNFRPEQMNGYELGARHLFGKNVYVDIAGFYNHFHNLFSEDITGAPYVEDSPGVPHILLPAQFGNGLIGNTKGFEITSEWRPTESWRLRGYYSYLHMNIEPGPGSLDIGSAPGIMGSSPEHQVFAQSEYDLTKALQFDADIRYVSELPGQTAGPAGATYPIRAYTTADARFGWQIGHQFDVSVVGRNLLQPHHPEFGSDPSADSNIAFVGIKRSVYIKLTWTSAR
ncbi:TonB-dependent receptor [Candidatus Koribacter versatilis Ellin345]|uniref:TonB-dependent receptor n=1 Tax=Koribacter versatilis (strain Ellin345) TaxID=204669 RepID=Q1IT61_KORVE|nr:TonB-dependent receptor [Candidatus Koribacter versatilis]ABF39939.1 TonB-dependent receptor [Candidatus Koribacter versatilis Ellin345]